MADIAEIQKQIEDQKKSERIVKPSFIVATILFIATIAAVAIPGKTDVKTSVPFYVAIVIIELLFIWRYLAGGRKRSVANICSAIWLLLIGWEVFATDLKMMHPVLIPIPENVFAAFPKFADEMALNVVSSLTLLGQGFLTSIVAATIIGLFVGWMPKVREAVYPVAKVLAPIPAIVFTPYLVMLLHSFRAAAVMVIFLGIFWPTLMDTILCVERLDKRIIDSAKMMGLSTPTMIFKVILPYLYPSIVAGLKVGLPSAMLMLVMAEMYGASSGLGYFVINYTNYGEYTNVVAGIILVGIVVTVLDGVVTMVIRKTVKWSDQ